MDIDSKTPHPGLRRADSAVSNGSNGSSRTLLFGEISVADLTGTPGRPTRSNSSICNLVMSSDPLFSRLWTTEGCREALLRNMDRSDLPNMRLVCHDFRDRAAPHLFLELTVSFNASSFKPARLAALRRIGHHVRALTFSMPHSRETFLPPLIDPATGEERTIAYVPQVRAPSTLAGKVREPKYGSWELTELLIQQYPPLFHAATNIPSFIHAFTLLPFLSSLTISCPGQDPTQRYRRSCVDYALISLRVAVERAYLDCLSKLSLKPMHPAGLLYLQPLLGMGASPSSARRWARIRELDVTLDAFPTELSREVSNSNPEAARRCDLLSLVHSYLRSFSPSVTRLLFRWNGHKGPAPFATFGKGSSSSVFSPRKLKKHHRSHGHSHSRSNHTIAQAEPPMSPRGTTSARPVTPPRRPSHETPMPVTPSPRKTSTNLVTPPNSHNNSTSSSGSPTKKTSNKLKKPLPTLSSPHSHHHLLQRPHKSGTSSSNSSKKNPAHTIHFPRLEYLELEHAAVYASDISDFISAHRKRLAEFVFEDVVLRDAGSWDDALAPLSSITGSDRWKFRQEEVMDVPLCLSPEEIVLSPVAVGPTVDSAAVMAATAAVATVTEERSGVSSWFSRGPRKMPGGCAAVAASSGAAVERKFLGCEEHVKRFLRPAMFNWI